MPASVNDIRAGSSVMWPPGTVLLGEMGTPDGDANQIILQPRPTKDPNDPLNWSNWRKYLNFGLAGFYVIMASEVINAATPTWGPMNKDLGFSYEVLNDSYAVGCAATAIGAIALVPFALKYGRRPLYLFSTIVQFGASIWSAKMHTVADLMLVNIFSCAFAALAEVIVQMTIADLFFVHQRGVMNSIYIWLWNVPVTFGPLIAGYITKGQGWRWVWWWNAVFFGISLVLVGFFYEETKYCPSPSVSAFQSTPSVSAPGHRQDHDSPTESTQRKGEDPALKPVEKSSAATEQDDDAASLKAGAEGSRSNLYEIRVDPSIPRKTYLQRLSLVTKSNSEDGTSSLLRHVYQPLILLTTFPAVAYTSLVYGILVALGDVMSTTLSTFMPQSPYNFTSNEIGLMSLPKIIGITIGSLMGGLISDRVVIYLSRRNNGVFEPEQRLWCMVPFLPLIPAGAVLFGIGLNNGLPWPVIAVALGIYKAGIAPINSITLTYLTDSYKDVLGDAVVAVAVTRNVFSTAFIFALSPWVAAIGIKYVIVTIVLISTAFLLLVMVFIKWGKEFRVQTAARYQYYALRQYKERD